ncbi:UvrD-helicase domain-containing protein [Tenacibaculum ovolyticum]|uniref:UvrD-helicase domain-containing protein n=1 Tax=Tenacibaculum ovolyticum TaxID=104270 RepID=UPI00040E2E41|nr:UvrD-helicase domain-containing protein [Tenacibaculum ovolyticum]
MSSIPTNNNIDDAVDVQISKCLNPKDPRSFFLFAGAGSGKTKSLVQALTKFKKDFGEGFELKNKKIAIITYTNAAADEIKHRLKFDSIFYVNTIHSFAWELIKSLTSDIRKYLETKLKEDLEKLEDEQSRSRNLQNKSSIDRARKIDSKERRLKNLSKIIQFTYNPNGNSQKKDSLNHSEVIGIVANFIENKSLMQDIVSARFPVILVDESQDTKKELVDALFALQKEKKQSFSLGLFGDTMQRIYLDGKPDLGSSLPSDWILPSKKMNHRSNKRIVNLINDIRKDVDNQKQQPRSEKPNGIVRLFIADRSKGKASIENIVAEKMSTFSGDKKWLNPNNVKTLILEHHMAALRMGFVNLFEPLYKTDKLKTSLLDGSLPSLNLFRKTILPLVDAYKKEDKFSIARIVRYKSPLFDKTVIEASKKQLDYIKTINSNVMLLLGLWDDNNDPLLTDILRLIKKTGLFTLTRVLKIISSRTEAEIMSIEKDKKERDDSDYDDQPTDEVINAWDIALEAPFSQVINYDKYLSEESRFATHQGVKGLEYSRVSVIIDDEEARGNTFSYDKLFGSKELSLRDIKNKKEGKDDGVDKTRRLFYVACSRAKESLAIIAYSDNPSLVKTNASAYGWFDESEIEIL